MSKILMNTASIFRLMFTILLILFFILWIFISPVQVEKSQNNEADRIARYLSEELQAQGNISDVTLSNLPADFFLTIWYRMEKSDWLPSLYDTTRIKEEEMKSPFIIPSHFNTSMRIERYRIYETETTNHKFVFWIYRFNIKYVIELIILPLMVAILLYLMFMIIVTLFLGNEQVNAEDYTEEQMVDEYGISADTGSQEPNPPFVVESSGSRLPNISHVDEYRDLWLRNFRISERFKQNFPFAGLVNMVKFGTSPEQYIEEGLMLATRFFGWENPHIYLQQKQYLIDCITKDVLDEKSIKVPSKGDVKGPVFIPLFPYRSGDLYGYLSFEWNKKENFLIADILFFLKYLFSENAHFIFTSYKKHENLINILKTKLSKHSETFITFLEVDNRDRYLGSLKPAWKLSVSAAMKKKLTSHFKKMLVFEVAPFSFGFIGDKLPQKNVLHTIENCIGSQNIQHYEVSPEYGNLAVTWSCGVAFQNNRDIHPLSLINEAGRFLKHALSSGGDQIVCDSNL